MFFLVRHKTQFAYDRPVYTEPMVVRLRPREEPTQKLHQFEMRVSPQAGRTDGIDLFGNPVSYLWYEGSHSTFTIQTESLVQTFRRNPFDYLIYPLNASQTPFVYSDLLWPLTQAFLQRVDPSPEVDAWAAECLRDSGGKTVPYLSNLCVRIHELVENQVRFEGHPYSPRELLHSKVGACRDFAVLFIDCCRSVGIAARFVSGYWEGTPDHPERELHAWAEVYLPGAGWRGYDPSLGVAVADEHIVLAAAPEPLGAAPTHGTFRAAGAAGALEYVIEIHSGDTRAALDARVSNSAPVQG